MERKYTLGIIAIAIVAVLGVGMVSAFGFGKGFFSNGFSNENRTQVQEQEKALQTAIENNDYASWKSLMEQEIDKMQAQITEDNFNKLVEQNTQMKTMQEEQKSLQTAIENNDYSSWKSLMESQITQDNFNKLVERFQKMESMKNSSESKPFPHDSSKAPQLSEDQKAIQTAIENNDYASWKSLMTSQITENNFQKIVEHYSQMQQNKPSQGNQDMSIRGGPHHPNMKGNNAMEGIPRIIG